MNDKELDKLKETFGVVIDDEVNPEEERDEIDSLYNLENASQTTKRTGSMRSSATYASKLEKELQEERIARKKLEADIAQLRKILSELSS